MQELKVIAAYDKFEEETFTGNLFMLDNRVDPKTGMIKLRAAFENRDRALWPGQFVRQDSSFPSSKMRSSSPSLPFR